jgi:hypothetical protein
MIGVFGDSWAGNRRDDAQITTVETDIRQRSGHRAIQPLREVGNDAWRDHQPELTRLIQDPILNNVLWTIHDRRSSLVGINRGVRNP